MNRCLVLSTVALLVACGQERASSPVEPPGEEQSAKTTALEAGAELLQRKPPIGELNAYLDGFHAYASNRKAQVEAHHYCGHLNEDITQCVIYDGNTREAKLMGVEYIISGELFSKLPTDEKRLWHSHVFEVSSGQLIAPGLPEAAEHELMEKIARTYGKTWHMWHTDMQKELPVGTPTLMMSLTAEGQIDPALLEKRDKRFGVSSAQKREQRADIDYPPVDPNADGGQQNPAENLPGTTHR